MNKEQLEKDRKRRFVDMFRPYLDYYGKEDLTTSVWAIYFEDLKHLTDKQIEDALVVHRQKYKSFPQPSHLLDAIKTKIQKTKDRPGIEDHPEYFRHMDCLNELICKRQGLHVTAKRLSGDFLIDLSAIVDKAYSHGDEYGPGTAIAYFNRAFAEAI